MNFSCGKFFIRLRGGKEGKLIIFWLSLRNFEISRNFRAFYKWRGGTSKNFLYAQGRPICGPEIFLCGTNCIQNSMKNRVGRNPIFIEKSVFWPFFLRFLTDYCPNYGKKVDLRPRYQLGLNASAHECEGVWYFIRNFIIISRCKKLKSPNIIILEALLHFLTVEKGNFWQIKLENFEGSVKEFFRQIRKGKFWQFGKCPTLNKLQKSPHLPRKF
jgi:hypothetical protein